MPWHRCYSLNFDDLEAAVARRYKLPRSLKTISAIEGEGTGRQPENLEVVHLNGSLSDPVDRLTFSEPDYGERLASPDAWLARCSADILSRPVVYVGTEIHEPTLWQYIAHRSKKGGRSVNELRPGSYLVTPHFEQATRSPSQGAQRRLDTPFCKAICGVVVGRTQE